MPVQVMPPASKMTGRPAPGVERTPVVPVAGFPVPNEVRATPPTDPPVGFGLPPAQVIETEVPPVIGPDVGEIVLQAVNAKALGAEKRDATTTKITDVGTTRENLDLLLLEIFFFI